MLFDMAKGVWEELNGVFKFKYTDNEAQIYSLEDPIVKKMYMDLLKIRGESEESARQELKKRLETHRNEQCCYTGNVLKDPGHTIDYIVFVPDVHRATPIILGEEITHGEHTSQHVRDVGSYIEFEKRFSEPTKEFLGFLGSTFIAKSHKGVISIRPPEVLHGDVDQDDLNHWIGYGVAAQLVNSGKEIPYSNLFHAQDQAIVWGMIKDIVKPCVSLPEPEEGVNDALYKRAKETLTDCGLFRQDFSFKK